MSNVLPFKRPKRQDRLAEKFRGVTLCANNHHKWEVSQTQQFDTRQGKLVTVEKCVRCGKVRNRLT